MKQAGFVRNDNLQLKERSFNTILYNFQKTFTNVTQMLSWIVISPDSKVSCVDLKIERACILNKRLYSLNKAMCKNKYSITNIPYQEVEGPIKNI